MTTTLRGAFGATAVTLTPVARRTLTVDVVNCPHCGAHHASLDVEGVGVGGRPVVRLRSSHQQFTGIVRCPALGGRPLTIHLILAVMAP